jgi:hypothetical protein
MPNAGKADFDISDARNYRQEAGMNSPYGKVSYRVLTNQDAGFGFYQNGSVEDHHMAASGYSHESVGLRLSKSKTGKSDPILPAKAIVAKHGDIILDARDGDIILKGDNILMQANGTLDTEDGDIQMFANKGIVLDAPDIKIRGDNVRIMGMKDLTLLGKVYGEFIGGVVGATSAADFGGSSLIGKLTSVAKSLGAF